MLLLSSISYAQQVKAYIKIGNITAGEGTIVGLLDFVEIYNVQYGFSNDYLDFPENSSNNTTAFPKTGAITFTKFKSKSSHKIFELVTKGTHIDKIEVHFTKIIGGVPKVFAIYIAEEGLIVAVTDGGDDLTEQISITMAKINISYKPQLPNGSLGTEIKYGWNFVENIFWNGL